MIDLYELSTFLNTPEYIRAQEIIQKLYATGYICKDFDRNDVKEKVNRNDYLFICKYKKYLEAMLECSGYKLIVSEDNGKEVAYIESMIETIASKKFDKETSIVILRLLFDYKTNENRISTNEKSYAHKEVDDLLDDINLIRKKNSIKMELSQLKNILYNLQEHQIVRIECKYKKDFSGDTIITVLPSISFMCPYESIEDINAKLNAYLAESKNCVEIVETEGECVSIDP